MSEKKITITWDKKEPMKPVTMFRVKDDHVTEEIEFICPCCGQSLDIEKGADKEGV